MKVYSDEYKKFCKLPLWYINIRYKFKSWILKGDVNCIESYNYVKYMRDKFKITDLARAEVKKLKITHPNLFMRTPIDDLHLERYKLMHKIKG